MRLLCRGDRRLARQSVLLLLSAVLVFSFLVPYSVLANDKVWTGTQDTNWGNNNDWSPSGAPSAGDNAKFSGAFTNQPNVGSSASVGGIWMTTGAGKNVTISGTGTLQIGGNTINGTAGLGILIDNTDAFTLTINCPITLGGSSEAWTNNSANLLTIGGTVGLGGKTLTVNGTGSTSITGVMSNGTLTKSGTGVLTLSGANTYAGTSTVSAGILNIQNATGLGTTAGGTTVSSGATLQLQGNITVGAEALTISGTGASGQNGALVNVSGTNNYGGLLTLGAATTISSDSGTLNLTNAGIITGSGFGLTLTGSGSGSISSIIGTVTGSLTKSGSGTWTLSGANTYAGGTNINGGTLALGSSGALGPSGTISFGGGTLQYSASNTTDYSGRFSTAINQAYSIDTNSQTVTFATALTSSGGNLTKLGAGTLILSAANTYTAGTTVSAGTLQLSGSGTLGSTSGSLTVNGGTVDLNGTNQTVGALNGSSGTILNNSTTTAATLTVGQGNASGSYAGVIADHTSGTKTLALTKTGSGTETLTGINTFTGSTIINGGTLTLAAGSPGALNSTSSITVNSGGTLLLGASNQINDSAGITLHGGIFATGGFSEGSTSFAGVGALTLTASGSHIDFGTGAVGVLRFASFTPGSFFLTIDNWAGTPGSAGGPGTDRLLFESDQSSNIIANSFTFTGYTGVMEIALGGSLFEVVPMTPEPSTYAAGSLTLLALFGHGRRRSRNSLRRRRTSLPSLPG
jgi:fibronectin-binding autotransporter adhesin